MKALRLSIHLILLLFLFSCRNDDSKRLLVGDWISVEDTTGIDLPGNYARTGRISYSFLNDSIVDTKIHYYRTAYSEEGDRIVRFLGTKTKYKVVNDSLMIYDATDLVWNGRKLKKITGDSLVLTETNREDLVLVRDEYNSATKTKIDQIALSSSGCYGSCPIMNIIIDSDGGVVYYGERYVDSLGFFVGKISKETFTRIANKFERSGIEELDQNYFADWSDDEEISTTFCSKNRFINSIEDYANVGPDELVWAYPLLRYLPQEIELHRMDSTELPVYLDLHYFSFETANEAFILSQSESFLLWNYLRNGIRIDRSFKKEFTLKFRRNYVWASNDLDDYYNQDDENRVMNIWTDGQTYAFDIEGENPVSIDIGFNFFEENRKFIKIKDKKVSSVK